MAACTAATEHPPSWPPPRHDGRLVGSHTRLSAESMLTCFCCGAACRGLLWPITHGTAPLIKGKRRGRAAARPSGHSDVTAGACRSLHTRPSLLGRRVVLLDVTDRTRCICSFGHEPGLLSQDALCGGPRRHGFPPPGERVRSRARPHVEQLRVQGRHHQRGSLVSRLTPVHPVATLLDFRIPDRSRLLVIV